MRTSFLFTLAALPLLASAPSSPLADDEVDVTATVTFGAAGATSVTIDLGNIDTSIIGSHEGDFVFVWAGTNPGQRPTKASATPATLPLSSGVFTAKSLDLAAVALPVAANDDRVWIFVRLGLKPVDDDTGAPYSRYYGFEFREVPGETYGSYKLYDLGK
jgi:hypothetical protein